MASAEILSSHAVSRPLVYDIGRGLLASHFFRATLLSGVIVGGVFATALSPAPWVVVALAVEAFVLGLIAQLPNRGHVKISAEAGVFLNFFVIPKRSVIIEDTESKLFIGSLPNRLERSGEELVDVVGAVLSVNEPWEREPIGLLCPYRATDWRDRLGMQYAELNRHDWTNLSNDQLNQAADQINVWRRDELSVLVHCRLGMGRSAMAVAAYLIKHQQMSVDSACALIKEKRPVSIIEWKKEALYAFKASLDARSAS